MNRRKLLAAVASGITGSLAGCTGMSSSVADIVEERAGSSSTNLAVELSTSGPALLIKPTESLPKKALLYQDGEKVTSVPMVSVGSSAYKEIIDCEKVENPEKRMFEPGTIELVFIDDGGEEMGRKEWEFQPHPVAEQFTIATTSTYSPGSHLSETTPIFQLQNLGTGPTCLSSIEITNPRKTVQLDGGEQHESPMLRTGTFSLSSGQLSIHEPANDESRSLLPVRQDCYPAIDGLFTVDLDSDIELSEEIPDQIEQSFDLIIHTGYGKSYTTTVNTVMTGGITQPEKNDAPWTHRYQTVRFDSTSYEGPAVSN
jgi:hypothetical protein